MDGGARRARSHRGALGHSASRRSRHTGRGVPLRLLLATAAPVDAAEGATTGEIEGGRYLRHLHVGSYARLDDAHDALLRGLLLSGKWRLREAPILHEYLNDPENTPEAQLRTRIYLPMDISEVAS